MEPKKPPTRLRGLLLVLALVTAVLLGRALGSWTGVGFGARPTMDSTSPRGAEGSAAAGDRSGEGGVRPRPGDRLAQLQLAELGRGARLSPAGRDPWRFDDPPIPTVLTHSRPVVALPAVAATLPAAAAAPVLPPPPVPSLRYLGTFGPPERKIAVFSDGRQWIHLLEGERLDSHFRVVRVGFAFADVERVDLPGAPVVRLQAERP